MSHSHTHTPAHMCTMRHKPSVLDRGASAGQQYLCMELIVLKQQPHAAGALSSCSNLVNHIQIGASTGYSPTAWRSKAKAMATDTQTKKGAIGGCSRLPKDTVSLRSRRKKQRLPGFMACKHTQSVWYDSQLHWQLGLSSPSA